MPDAPAGSAALLPAAFEVDAAAVEVAARAAAEAARRRRRVAPRRDADFGDRPAVGGGETAEAVERAGTLRA